MENLKQEIIEALKEVYDPEIPINIYDLGLIYNIKTKKSGFVHITMSLTSPTCPTAEYIQEMIDSAVKAIQGVTEVEIELTFEPRWTPDRVTDEAKEELGLADTPDSGINNMFGHDTMDMNETTKEKICKKCMISDDKIPLIKTSYNSKDELFCLKCLNTF